MEQPEKKAERERLKQGIQKLERARQTIGPHRPHGFRFGVPAIDEGLAGTNFPFAGLHEIQGNDEANYAVANAFVTFITARLSGGILWCVGKKQVYAPALEAMGMITDKIHFFNANDDEIALNAMEEGLRHSSLGAVVGEVRRLSFNSSRRLILAAEKSNVPAFVLRPPSRNRKPEHVACGSRWQLSSLPSGPLPAPGVGKPRWRVELLRCRGSRTGEWSVECHGSSSNFRLLSMVGSRTTSAPISSTEQIA